MTNPFLGYPSVHEVQQYRITQDMRSLRKLNWQHLERRVERGERLEPSAQDSLVQLRKEFTTVQNHRDSSDL